MSLWVKICGIKRLEDAQLAASTGANAIGLLVGQEHASSDFISPERAADITANLPITCASVMVTHLTDPKEIIALLHIVHPTMLQLHGDCSVEGIAQIKDAFPSLYIIKAIHVTGAEAMRNAKAFAPYADALLLDTTNKETGQIGGTGKTHDWSISADIVEKIDCNVILAGGLNPENIQEAIRMVKPYGVDVNSGVKGDDGFKDSEKVEAFIRLAKGE